VPVTAQYRDYASEVAKLLSADGFFAEADLSSFTLDRRIRSAELSQTNFILVVGGQEESSSASAILTEMHGLTTARRISQRAEPRRPQLEEEGHADRPRRVPRQASHLPSRADSRLLAVAVHVHRRRMQSGD